MGYPQIFNQEFEFPDEIDSTVQQFATYIPNRSPEFKIHKTEALAHSALGGRSYDEPFAKYELQGGKWVKVFEYQPASHCSICNNQFSLDRWKRPSRNTSLSDAPKWNKAPICDNCHATQKEQRDRARREQRDLEELARLKNMYE